MNQILNSILYALQFLTVFPVKLKSVPDKNTVSKTIMLFPAVGLCIGFTLAFCDRLLYHLFPNSVTSLLLVVILIVMTGGLHQDGLADTFDGLAGGNDREKTLAIMRDSRIGTFGVIGLFCSLWLKTLAIISLPPAIRTAALLMMPAVGRWSMILPLYAFSYARTEGKAKIFFESTDTKVILISTALMLAPAFVLLRFKGVLAAALAGAAAYIFARFISGKIRGITGDTLGAVNEICEIIFLLMIVVFAK